MSVFHQYNAIDENGLLTKLADKTKQFWTSRWLRLACVIYIHVCSQRDYLTCFPVSLHAMLVKETKKKIYIYIYFSLLFDSCTLSTFLKMSSQI